MGTRSNIGIQHPDGSYDVIYCHWDGYPSNNGKILYEHYQDLNKIKKLIALGDISSLGEETGTKHPFEQPSRFKGNSWEEKNPAYETFMKKYGKMTTAYGRDRGEKDCAADHYKNYDELCAMLEEAWTEWLYLYRIETGKWYYTNNPSPTWFKTCGETSMQTMKLTPAAWEEEPKTVNADY